MRRGDGVRMHPSEAHQGELRCRSWVIDTSGVLDDSGNPLPRKRWTLHGVSRSRALAIRQERIARMLRGEAPVASHGKTSRSSSRRDGIAEGSQPPFQVERKRTDLSSCPPLIGDVPHETTTDGTPLFRDYVKHRYLPWIATRREFATGLNKKRLLDLHILPIVGDMTLREASSPRGVEGLYDYLATAVGKWGNPLKMSYRNVIQATFATILHHAANPRTCSPPLIEHVQIEFFKEDRSRTFDAEGNEVGHLRDRALSPERVASLLAYVRSLDDHGYAYVLVGLGLYAGCRASEACGRRWRDIDWEAGTIIIDSQVNVETDAFHPYTKTRQGGRIQVAPPMLDALRRLYAHVSQGQGQADRSDFILGGRQIKRGSRGVPKPYLNPRNLRDRLAPLTMKAWGKESHNYHALRHTFATTMADSGVPVVQIQRACRHAQLKQTLGYIHPRSSAVDIATSAISYAPALKAIKGGKRAIRS